ncbi:MAG: ribbon-helix-helix protein, CopG family [Chloroflexi bacterium]|nr:ribbon-helix-helix protein, CopG family [Chloroflexota bacterium]
MRPDRGITVQLPTDLLAEIDATRALYGESRSETIRLALELLLETRGSDLPALRRVGRSSRRRSGHSSRERSCPLDSRLDEEMTHSADPAESYGGSRSAAGAARVGRCQIVADIRSGERS